MARNGSGTYSVLNTFTSGLTITASGHNQNWSDLATEMTNSVAADGQTPITGTMKGANGTVTAPSWTFNSDQNTGLYRIGADNLGITVGGSKIVDVATTGVGITGTLDATGTITGVAETLTGLLTLSSTAHMLPPRGTTAQRSGTTTGSFRFNTDTAALEVYNGTTWVTIGSVSSLSTGFVLINGSLTASNNGTALTIAIKGADGNDPSSGNPVYVVIRNATAATGDFTLMSITVATSLVISSGSTMGATNATAFRLWVVGFNDGGTFRLGVINCLSGTSIYPLAAWSIASSTAEGGAGAADSAHVLYTGTAVTSKPYQVLGYMTWETGLTTAGTWNANPTRSQLFGHGVALPNQRIQVARNFDGAVATGATTIPNDNTIPQITEGAQFMSQAITPTSAANLLMAEHDGIYTVPTNINIIAALFRSDLSPNASATTSEAVDAASAMLAMHLSHWSLAAGTSSITFSIRVGTSGGSTVTFNGTAGSARFNGTSASALTIEEIMA